jgi:hypothetical protein
MCACVCVCEDPVDANDPTAILISSSGVSQSTESIRTAIAQARAEAKLSDGQFSQHNTTQHNTKCKHNLMIPFATISPLVLRDRNCRCG